MRHAAGAPALIVHRAERKIRLLFGARRCTHPASVGRRLRTDPRPVWAGLLALLASAALPAAAQTGKTAAPPPPVSADPSVTTAVYGDWTARCEKGSGDRPQRICEVVQTVSLPNQQSAAAQIAFGHATNADPLKLVVVLPVNVWFPSTVRLTAGDKDPAGIELAWRRCLPVGCFAESASTEDAARRWRGETGQGRFVYKDGLDRDVTIPVSFRGLAQALDALGKM